MGQGFMRTITYWEWEAEGLLRFGPDKLKWKFECPVCHHVAEVADWEKLDAKNWAAFACVGRWMKDCRVAFGGDGPGPCDYTGGGLFKLNPVIVVLPDGVEMPTFEFAGV